LPSLRKSLRVFGLAFGFTGIGAGVDFLRSTGFGLDVGFISTYTLSLICHTSCISYLTS